MSRKSPKFLSREQDALLRTELLRLTAELHPITVRGLYYQAVVSALLDYISQHSMGQQGQLQPSSRIYVRQQSCHGNGWWMNLDPTIESTAGLILLALLRQHRCITRWISGVSSGLARWSWWKRQVRSLFISTTLMNDAFSFWKVAWMLSIGSSCTGSSSGRQAIKKPHSRERGIVF